MEYSKNSNLNLKNKIVQKKTFFIFLFIILFSLLLRIISIFNGGQFFWLDEYRYHNGYYFLSSIAEGDFNNLSKRIGENVQHNFFVMFSMCAELVRFVCLKLFYDINMNASNLMHAPQLSIGISNFVLSLSNVITSVFIYKIVTKEKKRENEALIAVFIFSTSTSLICYSRHLLPYDCSIMLLIIGFYLGLKKTRPNIFFCGMFCSLGILTYNGYIASFLCICFFSIIWNISSFKKIVLNIFYCLLGISSTLLFFQVLSLYSDSNFILSLNDWILHSSIIQQGDFGIGWRIFFEYLWHGEGLCFIILLGFFIYSLLKIVMSRKKLGIFVYQRIGLYCTIFIYIVLIIQSDVLEKGVLYGRTINQAIPFLALGCCYQVRNTFIFFERKKLNYLAILFILLFFFSSLLNFKKSINIVFPKDFINQCTLESKSIEMLSTYSGHLIQKLETPNQLASYSLYNAQPLYPPLAGKKESNIKEILAIANHPFNYRPYQFMHFSEKERSILNKSDVVMMFTRKQNL